MNSALPRCQGLMFICGEGLVKVGLIGGFDWCFFRLVGAKMDHDL